MMRLSEVTKMVGVTRRALQEYDRIGLIHPTEKTEGGYWLYDESAVQKIMLVQIFVEAEYPRKKIKAILENTDNVEDEFDRAIAALEDKRKRITGMINSLKTIKLIGVLPESAIDAITSIDYEGIDTNQSFVNSLRQTIQITSSAGDLPELSKDDHVLFLLVMLGFMYKQPMTSPPVLALVQSILDYAIDNCISEELSHKLAKLNKLKAYEILSSAIIQCLITECFEKELDSKVGNGAAVYVKNAILSFKTHIQNIETED